MTEDDYYNMVTMTTEKIYQISKAYGNSNGQFCITYKEKSYTSDSNLVDQNVDFLFDIDCLIEDRNGDLIEISVLINNIPKTIKLNKTQQTMEEESKIWKEQELKDIKDRIKYDNGNSRWYFNYCNTKYMTLEKLYNSFENGEITILNEICIRIGKIYFYASSTS